MIGLHLYAPKVFAERHALFTERLSSGKFIDIPHEMPGIIGKRIIAFLEFINLLHHSHRYHQIIVLEIMNGFMVVEERSCREQKF